VRLQNSVRGRDVLKIAALLSLILCASCHGSPATNVDKTPPANPPQTTPVSTAPVTTPASGDNLDLRSRVRRIKLDNGMTILLLKREGAPIFAAQIKVKVGGIEEEPGASGLAHFFEHMAFKGTDKIGTKDYEKEKPLIDQMAVVGTKIAEMKRDGKGPEAYQDLMAQRKDLEKQLAQYEVKNEFVDIFQRNGGADLNASTSNDFTTFYVSMPSNKLELWAYLESTRLGTRVLRELFSEVDVVAEERRMRYEDSPDGHLYEAYNATAFKVSPYGVPVIGYAKDIQTYTPELAQNFYKKYYVPARMVVAVVGNFDLDAADAMMRKYFSRIPKGVNPPMDFPKEPLTGFPRDVTLTGPEKSRFYLGYHRPAHPHPDDIVMDVIQNILCEGRTSRLYKRLVLDEKKVAAVDCYSSIPGARLDSLFTFFAVPLQGHNNHEIITNIKEVVAKLAEEGPTEQEMQIVKNNIDAELIYSLDSNDGLASQLAFYESLTGDWQYIYELQDRVHSITADDVKRVLKSYFNPDREVAALYEQVSKQVVPLPAGKKPLQGIKQN
jgi:predicted Zn-dependent peptidase